MNIGRLDLDELILTFKELSEEHSLYIFCAGTYGNIMGQFFNINSIAWEGYFDNNADLYAEKLNGKNIVSPRLLVNNKKSKFVIATIFYHEIIKQLIDNGVNMDDIFWTDNINILDEMAYRLVNPSIYLEKINKLKNIHCGERCFIIGNGPSLRIEDLDRLEKENTLAANKIFQLYGRTLWRPTYYFSDDPFVIKTAFPTKEAYKDVIRQSKAAFTSTRRKMFEYRDDEDMKNVFYYKTVNNLADGRPSFSEDCAKAVYTSYSITYTMLQFAVYMGFKKIYLLGIDHNYSKEKNIKGEIIENKSVRNHTAYMDDNNFDLEHIPEIGIMNLGYESAKEYADKNHIDIYNLTRGGKLEVFPRKKLEDILE